LAATAYSDRIVDRIVDIANKPGDLGLVFATLTLMRSKSTLRACRILLKLGHGAESFILARGLLEQIAWAFATCHAKTPEELEAVTAPKAVSKLSRLIPLTGRLYGFLSDAAHINPRHVKRYIDFSDGPMKGIVAGAISDKLFCAEILLHLIDAETIVAEHIYEEYLPVLETLSKNADESLTIKKNRPFTADIKKHSLLLRSLAEKNPAKKEVR
jgi:hypothetical protein